MTSASCKKSEDVKIEKVEDAQTYAPRQESLAGFMKKAAIIMRRLFSRAVENNDWVEMNM